ncbi:hypothetical protein TrVE_jg12404 [Triparma verrucosa]|uniref:proline--tRNA ligase n=1 Tax=Triparma verrucosa TaxID=1606542 RepID=A0A9W7C8T2_9STRA|nr:hypothetical protein TrVE_jg12404 [Triparma verrucosa]
MATLSGPPVLTSVILNLTTLLSFPPPTVSAGPKLTLTVPRSTLSGFTTSVTVTGLDAVSRYYTSLSRALDLTGNTQSESWTLSASNALIPLTKGKGLDEYKASVFASFVECLDTHLLKETYLGTKEGSYADVVICGLVKAVKDKGGEVKGENVVRWYNTVASMVKYELIVEKKKDEKKADKKAETAAAPAAAPAAPAAAVAPLGTLSPDSDEYKSNVLLTHLTSLSITSTTSTHTAAFTSDELQQYAGSLGQHCKNIFLKDKKHGLFLVTAAHDADTNTKALAKSLGLTGANMRMAPEDSLGKHLDVKKGSVGPMCIHSDKDNSVKFVFDSTLLTCDKIFSHPGRNDWSTGMAPVDLVKFVESTGHEVTQIEFGKKGEATQKKEVKADEEKGKKEGKQQKQKGGKQQQEPKKKGESQKKAKKEDAANTLLALQYKKKEAFAEWYSDVIVLSEMIHYYNISGCYILRPWSFKVWEKIQRWFDSKMGPLGVEPAYFPMFISKSRLEKEKDHVEGFAPEVAWVTKSGDGDLAEPIAIRPTSETIMYPAFKDWISSHRDLPLKLNQWSNVVRWEFKNPTPFLRTREFLWQEGHTAHATYEEADEMVMAALELYRGVYEDLLAIPVIRGYKTEKERFAGGYMTTTCEAYVPTSGRAIQGATSHNLGQNFGKMFEISFQDKNGKPAIPWQTSWGITTRTIGVMVMVHGDDQGLVMPPAVSPVQVVIVPIVSKKVSYETLSPYCEDMKNKLEAAGLRVQYDDRTIYNPGWKFNHWEQKGVPVRIEVGPRDFDNKACRVCYRYNGEKEDKSFDSELAPFLSSKMDSIQKAMFEKVKKERDDHLVKVTEWKDFTPNLEKGNLILTPWCGPEFQEEEEQVKEKSKAEGLERSGGEEDERCAVSVAGKTLCIPFEQPDLEEGTKCFYTGKVAKCWVLWGRSY